MWQVPFVRVAFATCDHQPLIAPDDQPLAAALTALGVDVTPIPWTELDPYTQLDAPPILLRSTWDYHRVPTMFGAWLRALEDSGRATWNPPAVARGNVDKIYLKGLEAAGIAIPKTQWIDRIDLESIDRGLAEEGWAQAVLKPRIAATAYGTFLVERSSVLSDEDLHPARASGAMLQEVIPEIVSRGETSIVYFGGAFSHAVLKRATEGEFRVQQDFGGRVTATAPAPALLAFADRVMTHVPSTCLYARVDVVESTRGPLLMELELIEPELYFLIVPEAAPRLAALIARHLS
jgi:glutathione synthase/RimK-type ligase-like ATP-grasp enzyme